MNTGFKNKLQRIQAGLLVSLLVLFIIQYIFISPPTRDYFNVNLDIVTGVVIAFSCILVWLSIYNYRKINNNLESINDEEFELLKESYIHTWAPLFGACLICQLVYFHIYGHPNLLIASSISILILTLLRYKLT